MGSFHGGADQRRQVELGGKLGAGRGMVVEVKLKQNMTLYCTLRIGMKYDVKDQRTEIVLATTALVAVVALFLRWHLLFFFVFSYSSILLF